jgi:hypothetical protein
VPASPSSKKARRLADEATHQLGYQAPDDPKEFPGLRAAERESFNKVQPGALDRVRPCLVQARREEGRGRARAPPWMTMRRRMTPVRAGTAAAAMVAKAAALGRLRMSYRTMMTMTMAGTKTTMSSTTASG